MSDIRYELSKKIEKLEAELAEAKDEILSQAKKACDVQEEFRQWKDKERIAATHNAVQLLNTKAELKKAREEIKHLRFDMKAQPEFKEIVKRAREKGSTAEIVAMIRSAEWRELAERYRDGLKELEKTAVACRWTYRSDERGRMVGVIETALYGKIREDR